MPSIVLDPEQYFKRKPLRPLRYDPKLHRLEVVNHVMKEVERRVVRLMTWSSAPAVRYSRRCSFPDACHDHVHISWRNLLRRRR